MKIEHCSFPNDESIIIFENQTWDLERGGGGSNLPPTAYPKVCIN